MKHLLATLLLGALALGGCGTDDDADGPQRDIALDTALGDSSSDDDRDADEDTGTPDTSSDADDPEDVADTGGADVATDAPADGSGGADDVVEDAPADGSGAMDGGSDGSGDASKECVTGVEVTDGATAPGDRGWVAPECVTCEGAGAPTWELLDFQPQSCGYEQIYGLDRFEGEVTVAFLWLATCSFCQSQLQKVEQLRLELRLQGITPHFVGVISTASDGRADFQEELTSRGAIPFFQSTTEVNAWTMMNGDKDDVYIYAPDGTLDTFLDDEDEAVLYNLSTDEGYAFVREAIVAAWYRAHPEDRP